MADLRFHTRAAPKSLAQISSASDCVLADLGSADMMVEDVAALDAAGPSHLSFLDNPKYREMFSKSQAGACIVAEAAVPFAPPGMKLLVSKNPYRSYAQAAAILYPWPKGNGTISPHARIHPTASIGEGCTIEDNVVIGAHADIGPNVWIEVNAVIGVGVGIGKDSRIGPSASLTHCMLGERVRIHAGVRIGQDGFGYALGPQGHLPVPQLGRAIIEDFVQIGANATIDRGAGPDTVIGMGCVIDNLVQIAHNVRLGKGCVITAQVGISGSTVLEDFVVMGGQSGTAGHLRIGMGARIAAQSGVTKDVPAGEEWVGFPAQPRRAFWKQQARIKKKLEE